MGARSGNKGDSFGLPRREFEDEASPKLGSKPPSTTGFSTTLISSASLDEGVSKGKRKRWGATSRFASHQNAASQLSVLKRHGSIEAAHAGLTKTGLSTACVISLQRSYGKRALHTHAIPAA